MTKYKAKIRWTDVEEQVIKDNYLIMRDEQLAMKLGRTRKAIERKRKALKLGKWSGRPLELLSPKSLIEVWGIPYNNVVEGIIPNEEMITWAQEFVQKHFGIIAPIKALAGSDYVVLKWLLPEGNWLYLTVGPNKTPVATISDQVVKPPSGITLLYWCRRIVEKAKNKKIRNQLKTAYGYENPASKAEEEVPDGKYKDRYGD